LAVRLTISTLPVVMIVVLRNRFIYQETGLLGSQRQKACLLW
jgi:hypothetical protein